MTLFLQYNVNNYLLDGVCHLWRSSVLSVNLSTEQGSTEFKPLLCNHGYAPGTAHDDFK